MLSTHLTRRQLFWPVNLNKANFSVICNPNGHIIPIVTNKPMIKYNEATILQDKQQFRSFWQRGDESGVPANNARNTLAMKKIRYGLPTPTEWLCIKYRMGRSGRKFIHIYRGGTQTKQNNYPNIVVPEDVFAFVRAMDELLNAVDGSRNKIEVNNSDRYEILLHTATANGLRYDFELDLCLRQQSLYVIMRTAVNGNKPEHRPTNYFLLPIQMFYWLRRAIGEVFVECGEAEVQQQFGEPPSLPDWLR